MATRSAIKWTVWRKVVLQFGVSRFCTILRYSHLYVAKRGPFWQDIRGCIQKFPDWVDNEIYAYNTRWEATQRVMAAKLTRLTHKIAIQLHAVAESSTICSSSSRRPVRKLLDTPSYSTV